MISMHSDIAEEGRKRSKRCASTNDFHFYAALILDQYYNLLETALLAAWAAPALALVSGLDGSISIGDELTCSVEDWHYTVLTRCSYRHCICCSGRGQVLQEQQQQPLQTLVWALALSSL